MTDLKEETERTVLVRYYTYQGYPMKDELVCYYGLSTGYVTVCKGDGASTAAEDISAIALDLAGYGSAFVSLYNSALTAFGAYADITGTAPVYGCYEDFIQVKISYDICTKYTYADLGYGDGYRLGAVTQKVRVIDSDILQYYARYNGGREVSVHKTQDDTSSTQSFCDPGQKAIVNTFSPWIERINAEIFHHPIVF